MSAFDRGLLPPVESASERVCNVRCRPPDVHVEVFWGPHPYEIAGPFAPWATKEIHGRGPAIVRVAEVEPAVEAPRPEWVADDDEAWLLTLIYPKEER